MASSPTLRQVTWSLPKPLYVNLQLLHEVLKAPNGAQRFPSIEDLATHFLTVAVREATKELKAKARQGALVLTPDEVRARRR